MTDFKGFSRPQYTPVPDELFDELLPDLSLVEVKVLLYIVRRTFGFKKDSDDISIAQMVEGITTKDGRILDRGTGLAKSGVRKGIRGLLARNIIIAIKNSEADGGSAPSTYALRFRDEPVVTRVHPGGSQVYTPGGHTRTPPEFTPEHPQETDQQYPVDKRIESNHDDITSIENIVLSLAREFRDPAPEAAIRAQARRLYKASDLAHPDFIQMIYEARSRTRLYQGKQGNGQIGNKAAYFLATLRSLV